MTYSRYDEDIREDARREAFEDKMDALQPDSQPRCGGRWRLTETSVFGADADGRRGAPLHVFECSNGCCEVEVVG